MACLLQHLDRRFSQGAPGAKSPRLDGWPVGWLRWLVASQRRGIGKRPGRERRAPTKRGTGLESQVRSLIAAALVLGPAQPRQSRPVRWRVPEKRECGVQGEAACSLGDETGEQEGRFGGEGKDGAKTQGTETSPLEPLVRGFPSGYCARVRRASCSGVGEEPGPPEEASEKLTDRCSSPSSDSSMRKESEGGDGDGDDGRQTAAAAERRRQLTGSGADENNERLAGWLAGASINALID